MSLDMYATAPKKMSGKPLPSFMYGNSAKIKG